MNIGGGVSDILCVGNTSAALDGDLNSISTWGCNIQGQLASQGNDERRCVPGKIATSKDSLAVPVVLRGHYEDADSPDAQGMGRCTLSYMSDAGDIFVWAYFNIPVNGCEAFQPPKADPLKTAGRGSQMSVSDNLSKRQSSTGVVTKRLSCQDAN